MSGRGKGPGELMKEVGMMAGRQARVVIVTCANRTEARRLAHAVVEKRLAACANIFVSGVASVYRWKGRMETASEVMMLLKTTAKQLPGLEREVKRLHSYDVPEFVVVPVVAGSREYLSWIVASVH